MGVLWPQPSKLFGLFSLKTGFYSYIVFHLLWNSNALRWSWTLFDYELATDDSLPEELSTDVEDDLVRRKSVVNGMQIGVTVYFVVQIMSVVFLIVGYWKSKPVIMKLYIYYSMVRWIIQFLIGYIISLNFDMPGRIILSILTLIHAYMLLILRTFYLQITGKSRLEFVNSNSESGLSSVINSTERSDSRNSTNRRHHCSTCMCGQSIASISESLRYQRLNSDTVTNSHQSSSDDRSFECEIGTIDNDDSKPVNFKDECVIYDEEQLARSRTDLSGESSSNVRNCTVNIRVPLNQEIMRDDDMFPIDEKDTPIIYDINQLNVGSSPVLEDNPIVTSAASTVK